MVEISGLELKFAMLVERLEEIFNEMDEITESKVREIVINDKEIRIQFIGEEIVIERES